MNSTESLFDAGGLRRMLDRIARLGPDATRRWGTMSLPQMLRHCQQPLRVATGELPLRRNLIGMLFGRMAKKKLLAPAPWKHGMPTAPEFKVRDDCDFATEHAALLDLVRRFGEGGPAGLTKAPHPFFGPLTTQEWSALQWRHLDHHLRQFGV